MIGCLLVILWLTIFFIISFLFIKLLKIDSYLLGTIFVWSFLMIFIGIFETLLLFYSSYLEDKSQHYYNKNLCYWNEDNSIWDIFSYKMYIDLYADYSLCDKRYGENVKNNQGCRFVLLGEVVHGIFSFIMSFIIMFLFFLNYNKLYIYLASIIFSAIQFAIITWYLSSVGLEMNFVKNENFWWPPLIWNVFWVIIPLYIIYGSIQQIALNNK